MDATTSDTGSDTLSLASWEKERSSEELRSFVELHHAALPTSITLE